MAIAVIYRPPAMTAEQYRDSWTGGPPVGPPPGLISHAGIGDGAAFFTVTVWQSREAYDAFAPVFAQAMREIDRRTVDQDQVDFRMRYAESFDHVLDAGITCAALAKCALSAVRREKRIQFGMETKIRSGHELRAEE